MTGGQATTGQNTSTTTMIQRTGRVVLDLVDDSGDVIAYDDTAHDAASVKGQFPGAMLNDPPANHRFILYDSLDSIQRLNVNLRQTLLENFNSGRWIVGIEGSGPALKSALGLLPPALQVSAVDAWKRITSSANFSAVRSK